MTKEVVPNVELIKEGEFAQCCCANPLSVFIILKGLRQAMNTIKYPPCVNWQVMSWHHGAVMCHMSRQRCHTVVGLKKRAVSAVCSSKAKPWRLLQKEFKRASSR